MKDKLFRKSNKGWHGDKGRHSKAKLTGKAGPIYKESGYSDIKDVRLSAKKLPIIKLGKKIYFIDKRLGEIRNVKNPHDAESISPELLDFWEKHKWLREDYDNLTAKVIIQKEMGRPIKKGRMAGYSTDMPEKKRHTILRKLGKKYGEKTVMGMLQFGAVVRKNRRSPEVVRQKKMFQRDRKWVASHFAGKTFYSKGGALTAKQIFPFQKPTVMETMAVESMKTMSKPDREKCVQACMKEILKYGYVSEDLCREIIDFHISKTKKILTAKKWTKFPLRTVKKVFDKYHDKKHWKNPIDVIVPTKQEADILAEGIRFYQADVAKIIPVKVPVRHKEGLVWMEGTAYKVTSKGYQAW